MAGDRSSAASGGDSSSDDNWSSLLREADPDDVEEIALRIALRRSTKADPAAADPLRQRPASSALPRSAYILSMFVVWICTVRR